MYTLARVASADDATSSVPLRQDTDENVLMLTVAVTSRPHVVGIG